MSRPAAPQPVQVFQNPASGTAQLAHSGWSRVPAWTGASRPQYEHTAHDRAHAAHQDSPVVLETMHGPVRTQTEQVKVFRGVQVGQTGPPAVRVVTRRRRPPDRRRMPAAVQQAQRAALILVGSIRQCVRLSPAESDGVDVRLHRSR
jgi:hypothetical protein